MEPNTIVYQEDHIILTKVSSNSTSVSTAGLTSVSTFVQGLYLQYLHKAVITICVYIISIKAFIRLYTYYYYYKCLYKFLYMRLFYIISTKASLPLYTYYCLYLHLYGMKFYDQFYVHFYKVNSYNHLYLCF